MSTSNFGIGVKIFSKIMDNKFYQTLISVFLTFITYFFLDDELLIIKKFGQFWSVVFIFICWLLIIEIVVIIWKKTKKFYIKKVNKKYREVQVKKENKEILEMLWNRVDEMSQPEKDDLMYFLNNNNKPLLKGNVSYSYDHLLNSEWVHKSVYSGNEQITEQVNVIRNGGNTAVEEFTYTPRYQYILKEPIYEILKYSIEKYGRVSHFN